MHSSSTLKLFGGISGLFAALIFDVINLSMGLSTALYFFSLFFLNQAIKSEKIYISIGLFCCISIVNISLIKHGIIPALFSTEDTLSVVESTSFVLFSHSLLVSLLLLVFVVLTRKSLSPSYQTETFTDRTAISDDVVGVELNSDVQTQALDLVGKERIKFERFANTLPIFTATFYANGKIDFISENYQTFFGKDLDYIKQNWKSFIHEDDAPFVFKKWNSALKNKADTSFAYRVKDKDNNERYFYSHCRAVQINKAGEYRWFVSTFDNSETELLRLDNDKLVAKLQGILQGMEDGFISLIPTGDSFKIEYYNFRAEIIVGLPRNADGIPIEECGEFFSNQELKDAIIMVNNEQITKTLSTIYDSIELLIRVHASPNGVRLYIQDITSEKASINELNLLRTAIDKANDVVLITQAEPIDKTGPKVVYVNDAFEKVTGYKKEEIIGKTARILHGPKTETKSKKRLTEAMLNAEPARVLITNYTKLGEAFDNEVDLSPLKNSKGKTTHFIAIERDISKQKAQEQMAFRAHKMDSIGLVTGGVAHDFNNLLTIILGNADLLLSSDKFLNDTDSSDKLKSIFDAANQGVSLTRSLLAFSKRQPISQATVDMQKLISSVEPIITTALGAEIKLTIRTNAKHLLVKGDQSQLESLFLNMAVNAKDAMLSKSTHSSDKEAQFLGEFTILIDNKSVKPDSILSASVAPGNYLRLTFRDNGTGIDEENISKIFDPFFSTKPLTKGTGLGLSMIYGFITQAGGHIEVNSKLGFGTDFVIYLPLAKEDESELTSTLNKPTSYQPKSFQGKTVLVVEDTEMVAKVAQHILTDAGFKVLMASDGPTALKICQSEPIDLLFTDIILPNGINGKELSEKLRASKPELPIIYTSGFTDGKLKHEDYQQENVDFLQKPYTKKQLLEVLEKIHL